MSKLKEFWICHCDFIPDRAFTIEQSARCNSGCKYEPTHVIDYSAYQAVVAERDDLLAKNITLNRINDDYELAYQRDIRRIEQLEAKLGTINKTMRLTEAAIRDNFKEREDRLLASREEWRLKCMKADDEIHRLMDALNSIIAKSRSWLITRETGMIEKPIHDSYRLIAQEALKKVGEVGK